MDGSDYKYREIPTVMMDGKKKLAKITWLLTYSCPTMRNTYLKSLNQKACVQIKTWT